MQIKNKRCRYLTSLTSTGYEGGTSIMLGTNTNDETYEDFTMSLITTFNNCTVSGGGFSYDSTNKCWTKTVKYTLTCNNSSGETINEVGFGYNTYPSLNNSDSSSSGHNVLIYRQKFDTPYTIAYGDVFQYCFTISVPSNPNKPVTATGTGSTN